MENSNYFSHGEGVATDRISKDFTLTVRVKFHDLRAVTTNNLNTAYITFTLLDQLVILKLSFRT